MASEVPSAFGHYVIVEPIGAGGMGEVFLATDTRLNRNVAIKVLPAGSGIDEEARRRMLREARMVATIDHPNVCTIYDIGTSDDQPYIVMQYIQGETLSNRLARSRPSLPEAIEIARQIASALGEAHARGVVHRDIKPGNVMINSAGLLKVLDFGLAKSFSRDLDGPTELEISSPGLIAGTTPYMSPEQLRAEPLDGRSDLFSLGVVLYEIASGKRPFDRPTFAATVTAILTENPPPLESPEGRSLEPLIHRALAKKAKDRFDSAAAFLEALSAVGKKRAPSKRKAAPVRKQIESVALLPFVSESADEGSNYIEEGLQDRLIAHLSHIKNLRVVRGLAQTDATITGRINVTPGSVKLAIRLTAGVADPIDFEFEREGLEIEALATEAAARIKDLIREPSTAGRAKKKKPIAIDPAAEKLYLRGRFQWNKRHPDAIRQAIQYFQEAVEIEPSYAIAWAGLADAFLMLGFLQVVPPLEVIPKSRAASLRAMEIDPALAEPHASRGYVAGLFEWDFDTAERELKESMRLNPNYPWAQHWYGLLLCEKSLEEAMKYVTRAQDLDPLSPIINTAIGIPLHMHRKYAEALRIYTKVIDSGSPFAPAHFYLALSYEQTGDYPAAQKHFDLALEIGGRPSLFVGSLGHCAGVSGDHDLARKLLSELEERGRHRYLSPLNIMLIHLGLGDIDMALSWLEKSLDERTGWLWHTPLEPRFDRLRGDSRFRELVARYGLSSGYKENS